jgi:hypothetical protein
MGKKMVGEELHFEDIKSIQAFVTREGCPPKEKKKEKVGRKAPSWRKKTHRPSKENFLLPKESKIKGSMWWRKKMFPQS